MINEPIKTMANQPIKHVISNMLDQKHNEEQPRLNSTLKQADSSYCKIHI